MTANLDLVYGTKILNHKIKEIGLLIKTWENKFVDKTIWLSWIYSTLEKLRYVPYGTVAPFSRYPDFVRT